MERSRQDTSGFLQLHELPESPNHVTGKMEPRCPSAEPLEWLLPALPAVETTKKKKVNFI